MWTCPFKCHNWYTAFCISNSFHHYSHHNYDHKLGYWLRYHCIILRNVEWQMTIKVWKYFVSLSAFFKFICLYYTVLFSQIINVWWLVYSITFFSSIIMWWIYRVYSKSRLIECLNFGNIRYGHNRRWNMVSGIFLSKWVFIADNLHFNNFA